MSLFSEAEKIYRALGVDVDSAFRRVADIPVSIHCWQGDDVKGFEDSGSLDGGIAVTGNYPGCARTPEELRNDIDKVMSLVPGTKRLNVHAIYAESDGGKIERNNITAANFKNWMEWSKVNNIALDFNPTFFAHPMAADGFTLSNADPAIRKYWVEHGIACRKIAAEFGKAQGSACITNFWAPDGFKDTPVDREAPRARLKESLDEIFAVEVDEKYNRDAMECKLFGIGAESCTVGSHEFYMLYAPSRNKMLCLDSGHFHPTESIGEKLSAIFTFMDEILLHVSRGVRWDSDHVTAINDELMMIARESVAYGYSDKIHYALDYFDASINRVAAWVIGARSFQMALLISLLEPKQMLMEAEGKFDFTSRLALQETAKSLPWGAVWDYFCASNNVPTGCNYMSAIKDYEKTVLLQR